MNHTNETSGKFGLHLQIRFPAFNIDCARTHTLFVCCCVSICWPQWDLGTARTNKKKREYCWHHGISENNDTVGFFNWMANWIQTNRAESPPLWHGIFDLGKSVTFVCHSVAEIACDANTKWADLRFCQSSCDCWMYILCVAVAVWLLLTLNALHHAQLKRDHFPTAFVARNA